MIMISPFRSDTTALVLLLEKTLFSSTVSHPVPHSFPVSFLSLSLSLPLYLFLFFFTSPCLSRTALGYNGTHLKMKI
uniref:Uncharacterized protein n=1 Tax=Anopheles darlingi TaxID=43151 RepID=A0A2M4DHS5_ANODA